MKRWVILAVVGLLATVAVNAQTNGNTAVDVINALVLNESGILLIPDGNNFQYAGTSNFGYNAGTVDMVFTSLEATGSFGGFKNTNDYAYNNEAELAMVRGDQSTRWLRRPSVTDDNRKIVIFTNLTNFAAASGGISESIGGGQSISLPDGAALQLGTVAKVGPGNLSIGFAYRTFDETFTTIQNPQGTASDQNMKQARSLDGVDLNLAYGFNLGEAIQLGFSLRTSGRNGETSTTNVVGTTTNTNNMSEYTTGSADLAGAVRINFSEKLALNIRAGVGSSSPEATVNNSNNISNNVTMNQVSLSGTHYGLYGRVNIYGESSSYEAFIGYGGGTYSIDDANFINQTGTMPPTQNEVWNDDVTSSNFVVGARGLWQLGKADFSPAVILDSASFETAVQTTNTLAMPTNTMNSGSKDVTITRLSMPFAVRYHFTEKFSMGAGARWGWNSYEEDDMWASNIQSSTSIDEDQRTYELTSSLAEYRLFMRYGNETFSGQLLFANLAASNGYMIPEKFIETSSGDRGLNRSAVRTDVVSIMLNISF